MGVYKYPIAYSAENPFWIYFSAADYSVRAQNRTRSGVSSRAVETVILPLPMVFDLETKHLFSEELSFVGPHLSVAGMANAGGPLQLTERIASSVFGYVEPLVATETFRRFSNITELSLIAEARRLFAFQYLFVPKTKEEADVVWSICDLFQTMSYPIAAGAPEKVYPPPLWRIAGNNYKVTSQWLLEPLVCVLSAVAVSPIPQQDAYVPRYRVDGSPVATRLSLVFQEFEPGTRVPGVLGGIVSKSEIAASLL
jgi:hypothetical protein